MDSKDLPKQVLQLEKEDSVTSTEIFYMEDSKGSYNPYLFLYHGVRFDERLIKVENIFKSRNILAGKYTNNYYGYDDNANKGEYVSLTKYDTDYNSGFVVFVQENIAFLVSPECDAILTKYVDYHTWDKIKNEKLKNIYSYMKGEFMVKDKIPFEHVKAIGFPYKYLCWSKDEKVANEMLKRLRKIMKIHKIDFDIVDHSDFNKVFVNGEKKSVKW